MKPIIVTSGESFTDIDAFACAIAYAELLNLEGKTAGAVLPGVLNNSITPAIRSWRLAYSVQPPFENYDSVIVDVSEPAHVAKCAPIQSVIEVYDHRFGFEKIWKDKIGKNAHIEPVGACTTLIWEEFKKRGFKDKISTASANILLIGTVSNTLDFGAQVTHERDIKAFKELSLIADLPKNWKASYFEDQTKSLLEDPVAAIRLDTKILSIPGMDFLLTMGQMELWNAKGFVDAHAQDIENALSAFNAPDWFMSLPSISEKKSRLYAKSQKVKDLLKKAVGATFKGNLGMTDKLWLRKEIRKKLIDMHA